MCVSLIYVNVPPSNVVHDYIITLKIPNSFIIVIIIMDSELIRSAHASLFEKNAKEIDL